MPRTTDELVNALMDSTDKSYTVHIDTATLLVDEELVGSGLSEARLKQIETYLAAHFATLAIERGGIVRTTAGESAESYQTIKSSLQGFNSTRFGQQAIALDSTGVLVALGSGGQKAQFRVV